MCTRRHAYTHTTHTRTCWLLPYMWHKLLGLRQCRVARLHDGYGQCKGARGEGVQGDTYVRTSCVHFQVMNVLTRAYVHVCLYILIYICVHVCMCAFACLYRCLCAPVRTCCYIKPKDHEQMTFDYLSEYDTSCFGLYIHSVHTYIRMNAVKLMWNHQSMHKQRLTGGLYLRSVPKLNFISAF